MSDVTLTTDSVKRLETLVQARRTRVLPVMQTVMRDTALATIADIKIRMRGGQGTNRVRSGRLRNSLGQITSISSQTIKTLLGSTGVIYAKTQEFGGTITPKKAQYLAIPLNAAKTKAGVSRYSSPRDIPGLFFMKSKAGKPLLVKRVGKGKIQPMFVLLKSVTLKPTLGLRETIKKFFSGREFETRIKTGVDQVMNG